MPRNPASTPVPSARFSGDVVAEIVRRTRAEQGLPARISDPTVLARLAVLIGTAERKR